MNENFVQAAGRHLYDCFLLRERERWDNAVYLAGYVVECILKALIETYIDRGFAVSYGHDLVGLEGEAIDKARVLHPEIDLLLPKSRIDGTVLEQDHPQRRYAANGLWSKQQAIEACERAREIYDEIISVLVLDGYIKYREV
ncbi:MAG: HEPN domain-containing protein [Alicyclobacillus herbarius]|uniref:HEPN domain-containing protein n=1 Tax=Alicyclobacillus herbarius TaxID=122960 RepID=UPI000406FD44|nr:HEPN domain-containing protein [Alicyclobacillus herbarius]MCL6632086.1 HEPN domain-containing protein [Alicyclobacillus herbarius]